MRREWFLLRFSSPQTPSQPEPNSGKPRSLREPCAVAPCAQHAHFPKPEFLALHVPVWLSRKSPAVFGCRTLSSAQLSAVSLSSFDRMATVTHCPIKHGTRGKAPSVVFNVLRSTTSFFSCLGHRILKEKIRTIPPSNRVTLMMTSTLYRSPGATCYIHMEIRVANTKTCKKHAAHAHCTRTVVPPGAHRR